MRKKKVCPISLFIAAINYENESPGFDSDDDPKAITSMSFTHTTAGKSKNTSANNL